VEQRILDALQKRWTTALAELPDHGLDTTWRAQANVRWVA
jgi:hypothetical protein